MRKDKKICPSDKKLPNQYRRPNKNEKNVWYARCL